MKTTGAIFKPLGDNGRIVIPKPILDRLSLEKGDVLEVSMEGDRIILTVPLRSCRLCGCQAEQKLLPFKDRLICSDCLKELKEL